MKIRPRFQNVSWIPYTIAACAGVLLYVSLMNLHFFQGLLTKAFDYVSPVLYSIIIAYLLDPIVRFVSEKWLKKLKNRKAARVIGVIAMVLLLLAALAVLCVAFLPHLFGSIERLVSNLEVYAETAYNTITELSVSLPFIGEFLANNMEWSEVLRTVLEWMPKNIPNILNTSMRIGTGLFNAMIIFIISLYMLIDKERLLRGIKMIIKLFVRPSAYKPIQRFFNHCDHILLRYIGSDLLDGLLIGVVNSLFMLITGMPYNLLISVVCGVTNLVPTFGPFAGAAIGGVILLLVNPGQAMIFLVWTLILQLTDGYIIKPLLFGDTMGLPAVWVLVSIIVGSRVLGMLGVLISVPVASIIAFLLETLIRRKVLKNAADEAADAAKAAKDAAEQAVKAAAVAKNAAEEAAEAAKLAEAVEEAAEAMADLLDNHDMPVEPRA